MTFDPTSLPPILALQTFLYILPRGSGAPGGHGHINTRMSPQHMHVSPVGSPGWGGGLGAGSRWEQGLAVLDHVPVHLGFSGCPSPSLPPSAPPPRPTPPPPRVGPTSR